MANAFPKYDDFENEFQTKFLQTKNFCWPFGDISRKGLKYLNKEKVCISQRKAPEHTHTQTTHTWRVIN